LVKFSENWSMGIGEPLLPPDWYEETRMSSRKTV
jgi:hypothetical protein